MASDSGIASNPTNQGISPVSSSVVASIILLAVAVWYHRRRREGLTAPLPPGPRGLPLLGYLPFLGTRIHRSLAALAENHGPLFKLYLGRKLCVVVTSPRIAEQVLREQDTTFANRDIIAAASLISYGGRSIAWAPYGDQWRKLRHAVVREMLNHPSLRASSPLRRREVRRTVGELYSQAGEAVDVAEAAFLTSLRVIMSSIWGGTLRGEEGRRVGEEFRAMVAAIVELLGRPNVSDYFPAMARFDVQGVGREMREALAWSERILYPIIESRKKTMEKAGAAEEAKRKEGKDFLEILLELQRRDDVGSRLTDEDIKMVLLDVVVGGTDTTTTVVEWAMAELLQNRGIMEKAQEEIAKVVGRNDVVEESHLEDLHYLDAVVKETLRVHPVLPLLVPRRPSKDCRVGGYTVPRGSTIFINVWAIHRDPGEWEEASEFRPQRFLGEEDRWGYSGKNYEYLPFGSGRRICPGVPLAEKMVMLILATLLHSFDWKLPVGEELDVSDEFGIILKKRLRLVAVPTPRLPSSHLYE